MLHDARKERGGQGTNLFHLLRRTAGIMMTMADQPPEVQWRQRKTFGTTISAFSQVNQALPSAALPSTSGEWQHAGL
ncbi:hypothetical protein [Trinickia symbiotica]|uniref:Uncharacterized protein n=1 Tax=Trinickia symbiotica TaxID=863227 RepID=A0A2N7WL05_9BURK|nr:hypothetical protein [Trinickia symbiotica]PMS30102.1 hypothetical protein C0Z20_30325 [Trinickia symbiotica]